MTEAERPERDKRLHPVRLWMVALALFACGFVGSLIMKGAGCWYGQIVGIQGFAYSWALIIWVIWWVFQAPPGRGGIGCLLGLALAVASALAILSSMRP